MALGVAGPDGGRLRAYWKYTVRLTTFTMIVWFVVTFAAIIFSPELNSIVILGFPLGYYMGAQGSLIVFVILVFNYAFKMNKADTDYGIQEETD